MTPEFEAEVMAKLRHIASLAAHADGVVGMVDNPHIKALRVASRVAQEAIDAIEKKASND